MGKSSKVKPTDDERALAEVSAEKWDRYKSLYGGVEKSYIDQATQDHTDLFKGRDTADVAQAAKGSVGDAVRLGSGTLSVVTPAAGAQGSARTMAAIGANKKAQDFKDKGTVSVLKIGNDMAADAQSGLSVAARASNTEATSKARAQSTVNDAVSSAIGTVAGAYTTEKYLESKKAKRKEAANG